MVSLAVITPQLIATAVCKQAASNTGALNLTEDTQDRQTHPVHRTLSWELEGELGNERVLDSPQTDSLSMFCPFSDWKSEDEHHEIIPAREQYHSYMPG